MKKHDNCGNLVSFIEAIVNDWSMRGFIIPDVQGSYEILSKHRYTSEVEPTDIRYVGHHFARVLKSDSRQVCKQPGCGRKTSSICEKCKVHLCLSSEVGSTCFELFHVRKNA